MKITEMCIPCQRKRALLISNTLDQEKRQQLMNKIDSYLSKVNTSFPSIEVAQTRNQIIRDIAGDQALMDNIRTKSMQEAEKLYTKYKQSLNRIKDNEKRFKRAMIMALAGNLIEFGASNHKVDDIENQIKDSINQEPSINDSSKVFEIVKNLNKSNRILYIIDNTAELVFDKLFIEELLKYATVIVSPLSEPMQDDAAIKDVEYLGIDKLSNVEIVLRGTKVGAYLKTTPKEFQEEFEKADLVIAKGMGCYESYTEYPEKIKNKVIFILKAKCKPVADSITEFFSPDKQINVGDNVIKLA